MKRIDSFGLPERPIASATRLSAIGRGALGLFGAALTLGLMTACGSSSGPSTPPSANLTSAPSTSASTAPTSAAATSTAPTSTAPTSAAARTAKSTSAAQSAAMIMIRDFKYTTPASVSPGATITVHNMDGENHTVTADKGTIFDDKATAGGTTTFKAPMSAGTYAFHCTYHSNMHGVLVVK